MSTPVEAIKDRLGIEEVVSSYIKLERAGTYLKAKCPFHNEKTPSFFLSPTRGTYYCFGCGAKGDIFTFVEQFEGADFSGALRTLASRAGVELHHENPKDRKLRERRYVLLEDATAFFEKKLTAREDVQKYLEKRGLRKESIKHWSLGYAPGPPTDGWETLRTELKKKGYTDTEMEEGGLVKKSEKKENYYDRFRVRIIFPIHDTSGRVIGFSGRIYEPDTDSSEEAPKYLNSPETSLFHKSTVLYGIDKAKFSIRKHNFSIVVEGQVDVIASHQAGFPNTVAVSGTSLTKDHLKILSRLSMNTVFAFDADKAGISSAHKSAALALSLGMNVKLAALPEGIDPADIVQRNPNEWRTAIRNSKHAVDFSLDILAQEHKNTRTYNLSVHEQVLPLVHLIGNRIDQAHFISKIAQRLSVPEQAVYEEFAKIVPYKKESLDEQAETVRSDKTKASFGSRRDALLKSLLGIISWQEQTSDPVVDIVKVKKEFERITGGKVENEISEEATFWAESTFRDTEDLLQILQELLFGLEEEYIREKLHATLSELRSAEVAGETKKSTDLLKIYKKLSDTIEALKVKKQI